MKEEESIPNPHKPYYRPDALGEKSISKKGFFLSRYDSNE